MVRGGSRGARPANLTRLSICGHPGWPTAPCGRGTPADQSARGGRLATDTALSHVAGLPVRCGRCGYQAVPCEGSGQPDGPRCSSGWRRRATARHFGWPTALQRCQCWPQAATGGVAG